MIEINRFDTDNQTFPEKPYVTENTEADLLDNCAVSGYQSRVFPGFVGGVGILVNFMGWEYNVDFERLAR